MISRLLPRDDDTRRMGVVLGAHAVRLGLGLVSSVLLARALGPERLGVFAVISATMMIAVAVADLGASESVVRYVAQDLPRRPERAHATGRIFVGMKVLGGSAAALLLVVFGDPLFALLDLPSESEPVLIGLAAAGVLATTLSGAVAPLLQALRRFGALFGMQTLNASLTVAAFGGLFLAGRLTVASGLAVGAVTALSAGLLGWRRLPAIWRKKAPGLPSLRAPLAARLWRFGRWLWLSTVLAIVLAQLDLLLLQRLSTEREVGYYALALNLALKVEVLQQTMRMVLLPAVSALAIEEFGAYARKALGRSLALVGLLVVALPLVRPFVVTIYGADFAPAVDALHVLIGVAAFDLVTIPLLLLAFPLEAPRLVAVAQLVRVAVMTGAGLWLIPVWGMEGAAAAKGIAKVLGALFMGAALAIRLRRLRSRPIPVHEGPRAGA